MAARRVLLVEDDEGSREALASLLTEEGYQVRTTSSGLTGLRLAREFGPDTIICDFDLPDLNGLEVLRSTRTLNSDIFFIILTADCGSSDIERVLRREADLFMEKPVDMRFLHDALRDGGPPAVAAANVSN
jgi:DNA-binding response OmpR family regulator